jgi:protein-S-isoprenylcysteine O-methyltransferase Ste14
VQCGGVTRWRRSGRALVYLGIIVGGWLGVLPAVALTLEYGRPRVQLRSAPWSALGGLLAVAGEVAAVRSRFLWIMLPLTVVYLEVLVGPWEERDLAARYGEAYVMYKRRVRKWLPRRPDSRTGVS